MATILLSAVGAAVGSTLGGSVLGLSATVIGRAVGATLGQAIDQRVLGTGAEAVQTGRVDRFRLTGASEGAAMAQVWGRARVAGQVIWASRFAETVTTTGGSGKGTPKAPSTQRFSYSVSLAIALCEGVARRVGRIWADGVEIEPRRLNLRFYPGDEVQLPDPKIAAVEGPENAPAYRGTAYVVIEDLGLEQFGNRVPQFTFEVFRPAQPAPTGAPGQPADLVRAVALIPGTGEYALATTPVHFTAAPGVSRSANVNSPSGESDLATSLRALREEVPNCTSVSLVVSWFGDDLRCGTCRVTPRVEQVEEDGEGMAWTAGGIARAAAATVGRIDGRPAYGGTPADASVIEAIAALRQGGQEAVFYPFVLMDIQAGNGLTDPWSGAGDQPVMPWRGRITLSAAPGRAGSPDRTAAAEAEVAAFFGTAAPGDFSLGEGQVSYAGPDEWGYRRFILHYAHLCAAAGGVAAFCIGSELRSLTQVRGAGNSFPAVAALRALAADVRAVLGPETRIGYAADWSEYFGYHPQDGSGDVFFHLDPLWADANVDFVGIDNYMPLSDWRDGRDHADAAAGSIYDLGYLTGNVAGGEGYDWFYAGPEAKAAQIRTPIVDGAYGEDWVFRYKDIRNWWARPHHNRIGGVRAPLPTPWVPQGKPVWFTELGCAAVDKGTNEPNRFMDPKSSESGLPYASDGRRDDLIQAQYLRAMLGYWGADENNPASEVYPGRMVDMARAHVWAWDARPWPAFPNAREVWSDGANHARGHWLNGRISNQALGDVVAEICERSGLDAHDVGGLHGIVRGYVTTEIGSARAALQPLQLAHGFDAVERGGVLRFRNRGAEPAAAIVPDLLVAPAEGRATFETMRNPEAETAGRVRVSFLESDAAYELRSAEAAFPDDAAIGVASSEVSLVMTGGEGRATAERWLAEARVARDTARFALPPSMMRLGAGDVVQSGADLYRIDRVEEAGARLCEAVRIEEAIYQPSDAVEDEPGVRPFAVATPVYPLFMDLPLLSGDEVPHAPHLAVTARPWPGSVAVWSSTMDQGYGLNTVLDLPSVIGVTETVLPRAAPGRWDRGIALRVRVVGGALASVSAEEVLNGANLAAIGDGSPGGWELFQFTDAVLVGPGLYDLAGRLRGQLGTDGTMPAAWPVGSRFVLMNGLPRQIEVPLSARGLARHYRVGPALRSYDDPIYSHHVLAFDGIGLRPYAPCHLRAARAADGTLALSWIRRTRIDGDTWSSVEVPLGEEREAYLLRVTKDGAVLRAVDLDAPAWTYPAAQRAADGAAGAFGIEVAQVSDRFGPGPFGRIALDD